jgi:hypothetical protein
VTRELSWLEIGADLVRSGCKVDYAAQIAHAVVVQPSVLVALRIERDRYRAMATEANQAADAIEKVIKSHPHSAFDRSTVIRGET